MAFRLPTTRFVTPTVRTPSAAKEWSWPLQSSEENSLRPLNTRNQYEVDLPCSFFKPNEVDVTVDPQHQEVFINCEHEEFTRKFGWKSRRLSRTYHLPSDVDFNTVQSTVDGGVIHLSAKKKK